MAASDEETPVSRTVWFTSIKNYHDNTTRLVPKLANPDVDDFGCAWVFSRLFKTNSSDPDISPNPRQNSNLTGSASSASRTSLTSFAALTMCKIYAT